MTINTRPFNLSVFRGWLQKLKVLYRKTLINNQFAVLSVLIMTKHIGKKQRDVEKCGTISCLVLNRRFMPSS
jgi:hypothetical protein